MVTPSQRSICFYSIATHLGGAERSLLDLVRGIKTRHGQKFKPWVLLPKAEGLLYEALLKEGIEIKVLPMPRSFFEMSRGTPLLAFGRGLRSIPGMSVYLTKLVLLMREMQPSLIHTNSIKCHALAALIGPAIGVPVVWHFRDILTEGPTLWTLRTLYKASSGVIIANSRATAEAFLPEGGGARITVIHNGLDPKVFYPNPNREFSTELGVDPKVKWIGCIGVLARWKGQKQFIEMASLLLKNKELKSKMDLRFVLIGGEIYDTTTDRGYGLELQTQVKELGIGDRVYFAGYRQDPARAINGLDLLVHASIRPEPFGRVVLEGQACGVPVVASGAGGVVEFVNEGKNGLLFEPGNVAQMAAQVERLLKSPELYTQVCAAGRESFLKSGTVDRCVDAVVDLYKSLC